MASARRSQARGWPKLKMADLSDDAAVRLAVEFSGSVRRDLAAYGAALAEEGELAQTSEVGPSAGRQVMNTNRAFSAPNGRLPRGAKTASSPPQQLADRWGVRAAMFDWRMSRLDASRGARHSRQRRGEYFRYVPNFRDSGRPPHLRWRPRRPDRSGRGRGLSSHRSSSRSLRSSRLVRWRSTASRLRPEGKEAEGRTEHGLRPSSTDLRQPVVVVQPLAAAQRA